MAHFDHRPDQSDDADDPASAARRARYGLALFAIYLAFYGGFMLLNVYDPAFMERTPLAGLNLAILYGFGLIAAALALALIYAWLCLDSRPSRFGDGAAEENSEAAE
jgi:uncharacterized membrane protein (DUF485 family)